MSRKKKVKPVKTRLPIEALQRMARSHHHGDGKKAASKKACRGKIDE